MPNQRNSALLADANAPEVGTLCFQDALCAKFGCAAEDYMAMAFRRCLHPVGCLPAKLVLRHRPQWLAQDFKLLRLVARCKTYDELWREVDLYQFHHPPRGLLRGWLRIRVSWRRLMGLAEALLPDENTQAGARQPTAGNG